MKTILNDAISEYAVFRGSQDLAKGTLKNETSILRRFLTVNGNIWVHNIAGRHVIHYLEEAGKTRRPSTLQLDHTVLSQFFDWARKTRRMAMDNDPLLGRRRPKTIRRERNRVHVSQFNNLLDVAEAEDPRDRAMVALLLYTLARDQEVANIRVGEVDLDAGFVRLRVTKSSLEDDMPISSELDAELRSWLTLYTEASGALHPNSYLLPRRRSVGILRAGGGQILGHRMAYFQHQPIARPGRVVTPILERAGFPIRDRNGESSREGSHTLRRSGARALFDCLVAENYDGALRIVKEMLHHASVEQTERYLGITADRRARDDVIRGKSMYHIATVTKLKEVRDVAGANNA